MVRKDEAKIAAEKKEIARRETAQFGKVLGSLPGSEEERRQQALAMLRTKAQARRDGKRVAGTEGMADNSHMQAPPKRAKAPRNTSVGTLVLGKERQEGDQQPKKAQGPMTEDPERRCLEMKLARERAKKAGKKPMVEESESDEAEEPSDEETTDTGKSKYDKRDRTKKPTEAELVDILRNGITWLPTRFLDKTILKEIYIAEDVQAMLEHMKLGTLYTMAYPTHKEVSCQFLASLEATFHTSSHAQQGWGMIKFKIEGKVYTMSFSEIGEVLGLQDQQTPSLPKLIQAPKEKSIADSMWVLLTGKERGGPKKEKNTSIRHPTMRYLHRLLNHTIFPKKEIGNVAGEELRFLHQTAQHFASSPPLPIVPEDFYSDFGMVGYLVQRFLHYKSWAWTNRDQDPQIGIGGWITPLLAHKGIDLGDDTAGPTFLDGSYLKKAGYFSGRFNGSPVYSYLRVNKKVELRLPNVPLTALDTPGAIKFDISKEHLLGHHGALGPMIIPKGDKRARKAEVYDQGYTTRATSHLFGPPRYHFDQCSSSMPLGPLRQAHDQISILQRWSRAQDRTIYKLTNKCKELRKTVKRQAEASAQFMRKVVDVLTKGAVAGCKTEDFDLDAFLAPPPLPLYDPSAPSTRKQLRRRLRNPPIPPSESGNKSPSLNTTDDEDDSEGEASASSHAP